ncbi:AraC family transcriptional regulator [Rugamonas sp.]|uniref:helix-turn-helix domain-containing protein n=1 Tax=Rugamonas sp. TaxID=1926287 RepID=UPI0025F93315|nr:AraC family transcriptional regulator [Rugamonas sp.]
MKHASTAACLLVAQARKKRPAAAPLPVPGADDELMQMQMQQAGLNALERAVHAAASGAADGMANTPPHDDGDIIFDQLTKLLLHVHSLPADGNEAFADALIHALRTYLAQLDSAPTVPLNARGGLAPRQERLVKEMMAANLDGSVSSALLAAACNLSPSHFARAFKQSTGVPPHRWLLQQRVEQVKQYLLRQQLPMSEIALACGFADQSHLSKGFKSITGYSPRQWQRAQDGDVDHAERPLP